MNKLRLWLLNRKANKVMKKAMEKHGLDTTRYKFEIKSHTVAFSAPKMKTTNDLKLVLYEFCESLE